MYPYDLGPSEIRKYQENLITLLNYNLKPSLTQKLNIFSILAKYCWEIQIFLYPLFHTLTRVCLNYFVRDCLCKQVFVSNLSQVPLNLISLTILTNLMLLTHFQLRIRGSKSQKKLNLVLLDNYFADVFTEV